MRNVRTLINGRRCAGIVGLEVIYGLIAAVVCGLVWGGITYLTNYEIGWVAWGVGLVVGAAVAVGAKSPNMGHGVTAAGLACVGLLLGKFLIFQWAVPGAVAAEWAQDPEIVHGAVSMQMAQDETLQLEPELQAWFESEDETAYTEEQHIAYEAQWSDLVDERTKSMDKSEKKAAVQTLANAYLSTIPATDRIKEMMSPWDFLWFGLAIFTAFKVGSGGATSDT